MLARSLAAVAIVAATLAPLPATKAHEAPSHLIHAVAESMPAPQFYGGSALNPLAANNWAGLYSAYRTCTPLLGIPGRLGYALWKQCSDHYYTQATSKVKEA